MAFLVRREVDHARVLRVQSDTVHDQVFVVIQLVFLVRSQSGSAARLVLAVELLE